MVSYTNKTDCHDIAKQLLKVASNAISPLSLSSDDVNASSIWNNKKFPIGNQTIVYINSIKRSISTDLVNTSGQLMTLKFRKLTWLKPLWNICVTNDHEYVPLVVNTSWVLSSYMTYHWVLTRLTRWVPLVEQELHTLPEHVGSSPAFIGVHVPQSLVLCVCCLSFCPFFGH